MIESVQPGKDWAVTGQNTREYRKSRVPPTAPETHFVYRGSDF